jgi:ribosomal protein S18 acetylase RimI-like enzyme
MRSHVVVRAAEQADVVALAGLWAELRRYESLYPRLTTLGEPDFSRGVQRLLAQPGARILFAHLGDAPAGMAMVTTVPLGPLDATRAVQVEFTIVAEAFRRRGVGRALMSAAAAYAEEIGVEHVTVSAPPTSREANRFYAQLGLTPMAVRRVASAGVLRRRLAAIDVTAARLAAPGLGGSVAGRRDASRVLVRRPTRARPGVRAALRRIAVTPGLAEPHHDS